MSETTEPSDIVERLIDGMCLTYRHDFGLLPDNEKDGLRRTMRQVFTHHIEPYVKSALAEQKEACARVAETKGVEWRRQMITAIEPVEAAAQIAAAIRAME